MARIWRTSKREFDFVERPLVMGILNITPDSFSDGGEYLSVDNALRRAHAMIDEGADIIDIGGESTRPGGKPVDADEEIERTFPVITAISKRFDTSISIDTTKSAVARVAIEAGAEIINDISGLRFDEQIAKVATESKAGLVLMHSRGTFESMHAQPPVDAILSEVKMDFQRSIGVSKAHGVRDDQIALDVGLGFGKTLNQNLELLAKLDKIIAEFQAYPMLVGSSRKSFIGKLLGGVETSERLSGSLASVAIAVLNGATIVRVHDVKETVDAVRIATAIRREKDQ
jgi:dihydropteroate synthase